MNTFGKNFRLTTFGESHGIALGAVIDGCPAGLELSSKDIQKELDRRKPGTSSISSQRKEGDRAEILSGIFEGKTLGTPIAVIIRNEDHKSKDYGNIKQLFRPGHADEAWEQKYGHRDYRGGGRSSGRETTGRVIGGAIAKKMLHSSGVNIFGHTVQVGDIVAKTLEQSDIENNSIRCGDRSAAKQMEDLIIKTKQEGDTLGGKFRIQIQNCPKGLGEPVFNKMQALISHALFSLGTVRNVELVPGKDLCNKKGSESNQIDYGISGGISNGSEIIFEVTIKPTPSIGIPQDMKDKTGEVSKDVVITGRHDPCILPRIIPVAEAMVNIVIADLLLESKMNAS